MAFQSLDLKTSILLDIIPHTPDEDEADNIPENSMPYNSSSL